MSRRYDKIVVRMEYTEDFSSAAPGMWAGGKHLSWQFLPLDTREERIATLLRWWHEDNTPAYTNLDIG